MNTLFEHLSVLIQNNFWLAPLIALIAGVLTSATPCSLSSVPLVIGYVGGTTDVDKSRAFKLSLVFAAGMSITFTLLGITASMLGMLLNTAADWWYITLGILMVLMALQVFEIYEFIPSSFLMSKNKKRGYLGAFIAGVLGGVFSSPCATPVLIVILSLVAKNGNLFWGSLLLLLYSIGHSVLVLIAGTYIGLVKSLSKSDRYGKFALFSKVFTGIIILFVGFYMFYLGF